MSEFIEIKKYANRRLYNISKKSYITLENVKNYIQENKNIKIIDVNSSKDITNSCLLQIILDLEEKEKPLFSQNDLISIIKAYSVSDKNFFEAGKIYRQKYKATDTKYMIDFCVKSYQDLSYAVTSFYSTLIDCVNTSK